MARPKRAWASQTKVVQFPSTQWGLLSQAKKTVQDETERRRALDSLAHLYWKPIYAYLRLRWKLATDEASDLTQQFFIQILEGEFLPAADAERGRFRAFLKACLDNFVRQEMRRKRANKRGGGLRRISIDFGENPDQILISRPQDTPPEILDRHWRMAVLQEALKRVEAEYRKEGRDVYFGVFRRYDLEGEERPTYEALSQELKISRADVDNFLRHVRKSMITAIRDLLTAGVREAADLHEEEADFLRERPW